MYQQIILALTPEILLTTTAGIVLLLDAFWKKKLIWFNYAVTIISMLGAGYCAIKLQHEHYLVALGFIFNKSTMLLKMILSLLAAIALFYSKTYLKIRGLLKGEYLILYLIAVLGMLLLISSNNFLNMYLAIELFSLPLYALIAVYHKNSASLEAAIKYFIMGALASGILLYGISLLYGASGNITFVPVPITLAKLTVFKFSLVFIMVGLFFKLGLVPFHMWLPDVYEGAPTSVTILLATAPKIAVAVVVSRFLFNTYAAVISDWQNIIVVVAIGSVGIGNLLAVVQNNINRMLAYSAIANIGFAILGFMITGSAGFNATMYYIVSYSIMYLGIFGVLLLLNNDDVAFTKIEDFNGLWIRAPWLAMVILLLLFAIVGLPPFAGFWAKFLMLQVLIKHGFVWLAILTLALSVIGIFYCLKVVKVMFFEDAVISPLGRLIDIPSAVLLISNCLVVVLLGLIAA